MYHSSHQIDETKSSSSIIIIIIFINHLLKEFQRFHHFFLIIITVFSSFINRFATTSSQELQHFYQKSSFIPAIFLIPHLIEMQPFHHNNLIFIINQLKKAAVSTISIFLPKTSLLIVSKKCNSFIKDILYHHHLRHSHLKEWQLLKFNIHCHHSQHLHHSSKIQRNSTTSSISFFINVIFNIHHVKGMQPLQRNQSLSPFSSSFVTSNQSNRFINFDPHHHQLYHSSPQKMKQLHQFQYLSTKVLSSITSKTATASSKSTIITSIFVIHHLKKLQLMCQIQSSSPSSS